MARKNIFWSAVGALAVGAIAAGAVALLQNKKEENESSSDDEIHFIKIEDGEPETKEVKTFSAEGKSDEVKEVAAVYPYLDPNFIEELLNKNDSFNTSFEEDTLVTIQHHCKFYDGEERKAFRDIMEVGGYETSELADEVVAARKFFVQNGAIISDILNVANQTNALQGKYLDYDIQ